jgi:hypothetical protein
LRRLIGFFFSYDHELKIQKARENARRTEKEKEAERYETLMHDYLVYDSNLMFNKKK